MRFGSLHTDPSQCLEQVFAVTVLETRTVGIRLVRFFNTSFSPENGSGNVTGRAKIFLISPDPL
jgi:hypothetical protein